jgi:hypothetical protein
LASFREAGKGVGPGTALGKEALLPARSLLEVLADIPDPRSRHGRRHPLPAVLGLVALGLLLGHRGPEAIAQLGRDFGPPLAHPLGCRRRTPATATWARFLRALDAAAVAAALRRWVASRLPEGVAAFSRDGKARQGSRDGDALGQHRVAAYAPHVHAVLAQVRVEATTNEHKAALPLRGLRPLEGKVVVADALLGQRDVCPEVVDRGGDDVLLVKGNQPGRATDVAAGFGYEAAARSLAAAFSPRRPAAGGAGPGRPDGGQGARAGGKADAADDVDRDAAAEVAGAGARV